MAVKDYRTSGGGGFNPLGILSTLAMLIPGAQVAAPWLQLANAGVNAANGNWAGAAMSGVGALTGGADGSSIFSPEATSPVAAVTDPAQSGMGFDEINDLYNRTPDATGAFPMSAKENLFANNVGLMDDPGPVGYMPTSAKTLLTGQAEPLFGSNPSSDNTIQNYLSGNNPMAQPLDALAVDITANQRMLNGTEAMLPWSDADETKYQGLLGQYGLGGKQAVGENSDMGARFADNNIAKQPRSDADYQNRFNELLAQYNLSDMDWTKRRQRNGLMGGL